MMSIARYFFFLFNFLHMFIGSFLLSFGLWLRYASPIKEVLNYYTASVVVINLAMAFGILIIIFGGVGSMIDVSHNKRNLIVFLVCNIIILILEVTALGCAYTQRDSLSNDLQTVWNLQPVRNNFRIQGRFNCCGYAGPSEYNGIYDTSCLSNVTAVIPWSEGCASSLTSWVQENVIPLAAMVCLLLFITAGQTIMCSKLLYDMNKGVSTVYTDGNPMVENVKDDVYQPNAYSNKIEEETE